jgi:hypothetical protein
MAQKIKKIIIILAALSALSVLAMPSLAKAVACTPGPASPNCICSSQGCDDGTVAPTTPNLTKNPNCKTTTTSDALKKCVQTDQITKDLQIIVNVLSAGVGIIVIAMIIVGGIQYSIAGDNATATAAARQRITNALIALAAYLFVFAFLQWLIPGGIFG